METEKPFNNILIVNKELKPISFSSEQVSQPEQVDQMLLARIKETVTHWNPDRTIELGSDKAGQPVSQRLGPILTENGCLRRPAKTVAGLIYEEISDSLPPSKAFCLPVLSRDFLSDLSSEQRLAAYRLLTSMKMRHQRDRAKISGYNPLPEKQKTSSIEFSRQAKSLGERIILLTSLRAKGFDEEKGFKAEAQDLFTTLYEKVKENPPLFEEAIAYIFANLDKQGHFADVDYILTEDDKNQGITISGEKRKEIRHTMGRLLKSLREQNRYRYYHQEIVKPWLEAVPDLAQRLGLAEISPQQRISAPRLAQLVHALSQEYGINPFTERKELLQIMARETRQSRLRIARRICHLRGLEPTSAFLQKALEDTLTFTERLRLFFQPLRRRVLAAAGIGIVTAVMFGSNLATYDATTFARSALGQPVIEIALPEYPSISVPSEKIIPQPIVDDMPDITAAEDVLSDKGYQQTEAETPFVVNEQEQLEQHLFQAIYDHVLSRRKERVQHDPGLLERLGAERVEDLDNGIVSFVFVGFDRRGEQSAFRADGIHLVSLDATSGKAFMFSFPRDAYSPMATRLAKEEYGLEGWFRINAISFFGHKDNKGLPYLREELENATGLPIDQVIAIDFEGFKRIIDIFGGVDIEITSDYIVRYGDMFKREFGRELTEGIQTLNGKEALFFASQRKGDPSADVREGRQLTLLEAIVQKAKTMVKEDPLKATLTLVRNTRSIWEMRNDNLFLEGEFVSGDIGDLISLIRELLGKRKAILALDLDSFQAADEAGKPFISPLFESGKLTGDGGQRFPRGASTDSDQNPLIYWQETRQKVQSVLGKATMKPTSVEAAAGGLPRTGGAKRVDVGLPTTSVEKITPTSAEAVTEPTFELIKEEERITFASVFAGATSVRYEVKYLPPTSFSYGSEVGQVRPTEIIWHWDGQPNELRNTDVTYRGLVGRTNQGDPVATHFSVGPDRVLQMLPMGESVIQQGRSSDDRGRTSVSDAFSLGWISIETTGRYYDAQRPPDTQTRNLIELTIALMKQYGIKFQHIAGHLERSPFIRKIDPGLNYLRETRVLLLKELVERGEWGLIGESNTWEFYRLTVQPDGTVARIVTQSPRDFIEVLSSLKV